MRLKFTEDKEHGSFYYIEEDFKDTDTCFHEELGFIFKDELGIHWNIAPDYSGIVELEELKQITDFMEGIEDRKGCGKKEFDRIEFDEWFECGERDFTGKIYYCDNCAKLMEAKNE